jgi:hypothetical protein
MPVSQQLLLRCQTSLNRFKITGLYKPPAIFEEVLRIIVYYKNRLTVTQCNFSKGNSAKPEPTIK